VIRGACYTFDTLAICRQLEKFAELKQLSGAVAGLLVDQTAGQCVCAVLSQSTNNWACEFLFLALHVRHEFVLKYIAA
jgi:hypothetical protein